MLHPMLHKIQSLFQRYAARAMFAAWSPTYEEDVSISRYSAPDKVAASVLCNIANLQQKEPKIADIGIGTGMLAEQIYASLPCRITGLDFADDMMAQCQQKDVAEILIKCDAGQDFWPLEDGSYDAVVSAGLIEYFTPPMLQHFIDESARILSPAGILVFSYIPAAGPNNNIRLWPGKSGLFLSCRYNPDALEKQLKAAGFAIREHGAEFTGSVFKDGSTYPYRVIAAHKA